MKKAQAITELAIFGSIILFLLSIVLTYGLRSNYQQQVTQHAFRRAMAASVGYNGACPYTLTHDRHIPSPLDPHGIGSVAGMTATYAITRSNLLMMKPDSQSEIPKMTFGFSRGMIMLPANEHRFETARFYDFYWEPCNRYAVKHLHLVFGAMNVWTEGRPDNSARVVDPCSGDILAFEKCDNECRMFTDFGYCVAQCQERSWSGASCSMICGSGLEAPDYCGDLAGLFTNILPQHERVMGVQPDTVQTSTPSTTMVKTETPGRISTTDTPGSQDVITRRIVFRGGQRNVEHVVDYGAGIEMEADW